MIYLMKTKFLVEKPNYQSAMTWAFILTLPLLVFLLSSSLLVQNGFVDTFFYTGYVHNYSDLLERYGRTYYSARLSFIYPESVLVWWFGSKLGYCLFRYLLLSALLASIWKISRTYFSNIFSVLFLIFVAFNLWLLRSLYYDYCDGTAIVYLITALHFLISNYKSDVFRYIAAGLFYAMATNCNLFALAIGGVFFPSWIILQENKSIKGLLRKTGFIILGFSLWYFFLVLVTFLKFPQQNPFIEIAALQMVKQSLSEENIYWYSLGEVFANNNYSVALIYPLFVLALSALFFLLNRNLNRDRLGIAVLLYLGTTIILYLVCHTVFKFAVIEWFYYFSYSMVACFLVIMWLLGNISASLDLKHKKMLFVIFVIFYAIALGCSHLNTVQNAGVAILMPVFINLVIFVMIFLWAVHKNKILQAYLTFIVISLSPFFFLNPTYNLLSFTNHKSHAQIEWDVYKGSVQLQKWLTESLPPSVGTLKFWYKDDLMGRNGLFEKFSSIQSTLLWGGTRLSHMMKMPQLDGITQNNFVGLDYLVLLGNSLEEVQKGRVAIDQLFESYGKTHMEMIIHRKFVSDTLNYDILILKKI